jgi:hypothetical protein
MYIYSSSSDSNILNVSRKDGRRRQDRTQRCTDYFNQQLPFITTAFLEWDSLTPMERRPLCGDDVVLPVPSADDPPTAVGPLNVMVVDIFCEYV